MNAAGFSLSWADLVVISTSGGKDSILAAFLAVRRALDEGLRLDQVVLVHADMGSMEHPGADQAVVDLAAIPAHLSHLGTSDLVRAQADAMGLRLIVVRRRTRSGDEQQGLEQQWEAKGTHSRIGPRTCQGTSDFKRGPIWRAYTQLAAEWAARTGSTRECRIVEVQGLASHESPARRKRIERSHLDPQGWRWRHRPDASEGKRQVIEALPIAEIESEAHVFQACRWLQEATGTPTLSWVYAFLPRLSCRWCVFAGRGGLGTAAKLYPEAWAKLLQSSRSWSRAWDRRFNLEDVDQDVRADQVEAVAWEEQS